MIVTHKINMNLDRAGVMPMVDVVQGDSNTREIQFCLYSSGQAWDIPADAKVLVRYRKANGSGGTYDTLPDGETASVVSGNTVTVTLAPQALSAAGIVTMNVTLDKDDDELSTFAVLVNVTKNATAETDDKGNYVSVSGLLPAPESAKVGQYLVVLSVDENGKITAMKAVNAPSGGGGSGGYVDLTGYATEQWVQEGYQQKGNYLTEVPEGYAKIDDIPKNAADIGALPDTYKPPNQTAAQVGADPVGTAAIAVSEHNSDTDAHPDIRLEMKAINDRLTAFFDSDDQTLDELSEIVAYITSNKSLIDAITTSKVSVSDIVNNLTTNVTNKPLSASQGVVLKGLIDTVSNSLSNYQPKGDYALRAELPAVPVKSVNGKTGNVNLTASDVGALPDTYSPPDQTESATETELAALAQEDLADMYAGGVRILAISDDENLVSSAISQSGAVYNGCGYMNGYRLTSAGEVSEANAAVITGYIPYSYGKTIEISGGCNPANSGGQYIAAFDSNFALLGVNYLNSLIGNSGGNTVCTDDNEYIYTVDTSAFTAANNINMFKDAVYIRISLSPCIGNRLRVRYV